MNKSMDELLQELEHLKEIIDSYQTTPSWTKLDDMNRCLNMIKFHIEYLRSRELMRIRLNSTKKLS